jgi:hypothetical protein
MSVARRRGAVDTSRKEDPSSNPANRFFRQWLECCCKLAFFSKSQCYVWSTFLHKPAVIWAKNANSIASISAKIFLQ